MRRARRRNTEFNGLHRRVHAIRLGEGFYQEDRNGSRYQERLWSPRLGLSKTSGSSVSGAITAIIGFLGADTALKVAIVHGSNISGETDPVPVWDEGVGKIGSNWYTVFD